MADLSGLPGQQFSGKDPVAPAPVSQDAAVPSPRALASEPTPRAPGAKDVSPVANRPPAPADQSPGSEEDAPAPVTLTIGRIDVTVEAPAASSPAGAFGPQRSRGFQAYARARRGELR